MLTAIAKEHMAQQQIRRAQQERRKNEAVVAVQTLTSQLVDKVNGRVSHAYNNQKRLDIEAKKLEKNATVLVRQTDQWLQLTENLNLALKEVGDLESYAGAIHDDVHAILQSLRQLEQKKTDG